MYGRVVVYTPDAPDRCRNGHVYRPDRVLVGYRHCRCSGAEFGGHVSYLCRVEDCGDMILVGCVDRERVVDYQPG